MYGITTVILFLIAVHGSVHAQSVSLVFSRPPRSNQVTLTCRDGSFQQLTTANFWLNSSLLTSLLSPSEYTVPANGMIRFTIRWDLEGFYSCGRSTRESNTLELVAIPPLENVQTYYLRRVGHMVTIACGIKPGVLRSRYNVVWSNDVDRLISTTFQNVWPRYELHLENFSLTIHQLQLNDQGNQYRCDVIVDNPQSTADFYSSGPYISLAVYEPPSIISEPQDRVISHGANDSVTYTCVARGAPVVSITWTFNGQDIVRREDRGRFPVSTDAVPPVNGASVLMSTLRIDQLQLQDSGVYECRAHITVNTGEREETISNTTTATLSVLTDNFVLAVGISTRGDLLLRLQLLTEIPEPLSFVLLFKNVDTRATSERTIHDNSFTNALEINSQVDNSQLPAFQAFTVQVAMMVRGLRGPFNQPGTVLRIDMPLPLPPNNITTSTQSECLSEQTIIIIASAAAGSVVAIVLLFLCAFLLYKIIRMSCTACWKKNILEEIRASDDVQFKQKLLDLLQKTKEDSGDAESENGTEKKEEEETTSELAMDAIVGQNKNMDKSNSPHSPPNYVGSTAVNSAGDGMESIGQELQLQSSVTNTGQSRLAIQLQGVPDLDTDNFKVPCNPPTRTNTDNATEPCQADGGSDDDDDEEHEGTEEKPSVLMVTSV